MIAFLKNKGLYIIIGLVLLLGVYTVYLKFRYSTLNKQYVTVVEQNTVLARANETQASVITELEQQRLIDQTTLNNLETALLASAQAKKYADEGLKNLRVKYADTLNIKLPTDVSKLLNDQASRRTKDN